MPVSFANLFSEGDAMNAENCGKFIVELRRTENLTQKDLAKFLGVTDKAISRWETGKGFPDVSSLMSLSEHFDVTVNELLAGEKVAAEELPELAEKNILKAVEQTQEEKKRGVVQTVIAVICLVAIFVPPTVAIVKEIIILEPVVDSETLTGFLAQVGIAVLLVISGLCIRAGHISLLHSYHYARVTDRDGYCKAMSKPTMCMGVPIFLGGCLSLLSSVHPVVEVISTIITLGGCAVCIACIFKVQYKYNSGLF